MELAVKVGFVHDDLINFADGDAIAASDNGLSPVGAACTKHTEPADLELLTDPAPISVESGVRSLLMVLSFRSHVLMG